MRVARLIGFLTQSFVARITLKNARWRPRHARLSSPRRCARLEARQWESY